MTPSGDRATRRRETRRPHQWGRAGASSRRLIVAVLHAIVLTSSIVACGMPDAGDSLLRKRVVSIDSEALSRFLELTAQLAGTPAARQSRILLDRAAACGELWAHSEAPGANAEIASGRDFPTLDCRNGLVEASALGALVRERRGEADGFVSWPIAREGRLELRLDIDRRGGLEIEGTLVPPPSELGAISLLVPGDQPLAAAVLNPTATLLHLRLRPATGIGLSGLIPAGSQADRLFALKGKLLEGALLTGTWEFAFMPPAPGGRMPLAVGALHHRLARPIEDALDEALGQLEATWPIRRSPHRFTSAEGSTLAGGCFLDLPLLPELAPCWVVTPDALLVGYRAEAIAAALSAPAVSAPRDAPGASETRPEGTNGSAPLLHTAGRLDLHLDRLERVDASLLGAEATPHPGRLFSNFELRMDDDGKGGIAIHARLRRRS
ncbi:MAG: hypothetical protein CL933_24210 [Deltaproteobacteria bacterium]|nr:hypothetical protein [Deltaproteobacteria bacterium]